MDYQTLKSIVEAEYGEIKELDREDVIIYLCDSFDATVEDAEKTVDYYGWE